MEEYQEELLSLLKNKITPATGCTEPIAVAYAVAKAREKSEGKISKLQIQVDSNIYKNGLMVTIPGTKERGLLAAAAFGFLFGKTEKGFRVIEGLNDDNIREAKQLILQNKIKVVLNREYKGLQIEVELETDKEKVRVITSDSHLNIVSIEKISKEKNFKPFKKEDNKNNNSNEKIQQYVLEDFLQFSKNTPLNNLKFLVDGVNMNLEIAREGLKIKSGVGNTLTKLIGKGIFSDNMVTRAQVLCASASEARMSGSKLPVMSTAGSGNHGITAFLTNYAVAEKQNLSQELLIRSLALTNLITFFIKSYTGTLSAMCGCGVAAGIGASAGVVFLLGGNQDKIMGALYNMVGSISGVICDGAKEGCSYKLALASGWAVQSALLALHGTVIHNTDGIVDPDFRQLFKNLGHLCDPGMIATDQAILDVMIGKN
ncbi:MAG: L-serine ammonia-lyase, iron-sulfur-dependent, subunit alpha [Atribacterota bacterium]|nr:L-serine ammonia-lyase, iron-sulfur-dependent, subunit alpha [Atribacterota bacterium]